MPRAVLAVLVAAALAVSAAAGAHSILRMQRSSPGDLEVRFERVIHNPASVTLGAKMPGEPGYDRATFQALTAYFKTFVPPTHPWQEKT